MRRVKLSEIVENKDSKRVPVKASDRGKMSGKYPYYGASGVVDHVDDYLFEGPNLLIGEDGANLLSRSTDIAFIADGKYWVNNHAHVLGADHIVTLQYLKYFINSIDLSPYVTGSAQPKLNQRNLNKIEVPFLTLPEQKTIVAKLDRAQRLIDIDREMLAKYDELIQSVFLEMFGDPVRNEKGWERVIFSKVFDITTGKLNANAAVENGEYPFFTCSREISWIDDYAFNTEALLLAGNNASGDFNIKHYKGKFNAYQRTYVLTSEENYGFLKIALDHFLNQMKSDSIGTNTKYLTLKLLDRINIPVPPINLQNKFNDIVTKIDEEKKIVNQQQFKKSEELFSSLVQGVFG